MKPPVDPCPDTYLDSLEIVVAAEDSVEFESPCLGQHGLSIIVTAASGSLQKRVLMDVGQHPGALLGNMRLLGVEPGSIDAIVVTHCHYDHTMGLAEVVASIGKRDLPVIAHPSLFRPNLVSAPVAKHIGVPSADSEANVRDAGGLWCLTRDPFPVMPGLFTTGEIARVTAYEDVGIGGLSTIADGRLVPDPMPDDLSLVAKVRGRAPVVLTGCAHAGIVNILGQVASMCGAQEFENVIGGFHLVEASEDRIEKTMAGISRFKPKAITPGHCTGFRAQAAMYAAFGKAFAPLRTGMRIRVAAG